MKETSVDIGKTYALRSLTGGEVQNANGDVIKTLDAGKQQHETAQESVWLVPDDCQVTKANFKCALAALGLRGEGENLPAWLRSLKKELGAGVLDGAQFRLWWRPEIGKLMVMTQLTNDDLNEQVLAVAAKYVPDGVTAEVFNLNKYAHCVNVDAVLAVNPDYRNDLTSEDEWVYELPNMLRFPTSTPFFFEGSPMRKIDITLPNIKGYVRILQLASSVEEARISAPAATDIGWLAQNSPIKKFSICAPLATYCNNIFYGCPNVEEITTENLKIGKLKEIEYLGWGSPKLRRVEVDATEATKCWYVSSSPVFTSFESTLPKCTSGQGAFRGTILDKPSVLRILTSLPAYEGDEEPTGTSFFFELGIHVDLKTDAEVQEAIALAEAKRWTLSVRWNGTPTAQVNSRAATYSMRRPVAQSVYARVLEVEQPDGTMHEDFIWGHYVTEWEANGYMEFASLEEAKEYFNITE